MKEQVVAVACQCIIRMQDGQCAFVGSDAVATATVERINAKTASEVDFIFASTFPVFDYAANEAPVELIVHEKRRYGR